MDEAEVVKALLDANLELTKQVVELSKALSKAQETPAPVLMEVSKHPLWTPESEEDAMHAFKAGLISKDELEDALKEIGFMNAELTVPTPL